LPKTLNFKAVKFRKYVHPIKYGGSCRKGHLFHLPIHIMVASTTQLIESTGDHIPFLQISHIQFELASQKSDHIFIVSKLE
jgi:hypothetical protein